MPISDQESDTHASIGNTKDLLFSSFSDAAAVPQNIQTLCDKISLASSRLAEDTDFIERSFHLSLLPPPSPKPRADRVVNTAASLEDNLALLEQKLVLNRRGDSHFESLLAEASR